MRRILRRQPRAGACSLLATVLVLVAPARGEAQDVTPTVYQETGFFAYRKVKESSGVAVSRTQPGVLWTHNDSGSKPLLYATNLRGEHLGVFDVRGADAKDWEDIALGPCPMSGESCLYIGDTGDNGEKRRRVTVYVVPEPTVEDGGDKTGKTGRAYELKVRYPDRPHDVEALAVSSQGDIYLITKGRRGPIVAFVVPADSLLERAVTALVADTLPIMPQRSLGRWVTGAAISPSGWRLVVRTYLQLFFYRRDGTGRLQQESPPCWLGVRQLAGEAVDFLDEDTVVLTTESTKGRPGRLARVVCPRTRGGREN